MDAHGDDDLFAEEERYKTALHYTVGKLSQQAVVDRENRKRIRMGANSQSPPVHFSKEFVAALTEAVWDMSEHWATDLEAFANHAKRSVINADDVRLLVRRSPTLTRLLEEAADVQTAVDEHSTNGKQKRAKKRPLVEEDEETREPPDEAPIIEDETTSSPVPLNPPPTVQDDDFDVVLAMLTDDDLTRKSAPTPTEREKTPSVVYDSEDDMWDDRRASPVVPNDQYSKRKSEASSSKTTDNRNVHEMWDEERCSTFVGGKRATETRNSANTTKVGPSSPKDNELDGFAFSDFVDDDW